MSEEIILRPHHGLCILHYIGKGYSDGFNANFQKVMASLEGSRIKLKVDCDSVCAACPNLRDGCCVSDIKVKKIDKNCLSACGMKDGDVILWNDYKALLTEAIIKPKKLLQVCGDCQWSEVCLQVEGL